MSTDRPIDHLPYAATPAGVVARWGSDAIDLATAAGERPDLAPLVRPPTLDRLLAAGPDAWAEVRAWARGLVDSGPRVPVGDLELLLPFTVADYVDCYASEVHASTVSRVLRPGAPPLHANWRHLPVSYHGRAGSVVVSGTPVRRPRGQVVSDPAGPPTYAATARLDLEAELGWVVGTALPRGETVTPQEAERHVFGVVGLNDWSARDVQAWETVPLGPHLGKSFATSVSAWVTPLAALAQARVPLPGQDPPPLPHLAVTEPAGVDIDVEVEIDGVVVSRPRARDLYWSPGQLVAHVTSNGAGLRTGDLVASGTISSVGAPGCLLELGDPDRYLADGSEVVLRYRATGSAGPVVLGEVRGRVDPVVGAAVDAAVALG